MKRVFLIIVSISLTLNVFSQDKKNQINFSIGPSFGVGDFGDESTSNENCGGAGTGANLYFYYGHKFTKNLGLGIKWFGNSNKFKTDELLSEMDDLHGGRWTTETSYWSTGGLLFGITGHIPTSEKFIVDFRLLLGYAVLSSPEFTFTDRYSNYWITSASASSGAFGYDLGAGFSYFFHPKWCLNLNLDYIGGSFNFDEIVIYSSDGYSDYVNDVSQSMGIINTTIGISFNF
jgi:hypothetical protein